MLPDVRNILKYSETLMEKFYVQNALDGESLPRYLQAEKCDLAWP